MANTQLPPTPNMPMMTPAGQVNPTWQRWFLNIFNQINNLDTDFAPSNATYIIRQADSSIPNAQALSNLSTGFLQVTTGTGLLTSTNSLPAADITGLIQNAQLANTAVGNLSGTNTGDQVLPIDSTLVVTDNTGNNVSTSAHGFAPKAPNDATKFLNGIGTYTVPTGSGSPVLIQSVRTTASATSGSTSFNYNNSIPQNTGGTQVVSLSVTPTSSSNILEIEFTGTCANSNTNVIIIALFQDSTAGALNCIQYSMNTAQGQPFHFKYYMTAGTTSNTTFKMRVGTTGGTWYIGKDGNATEGGVMQTVMTIKEYTS